MYAFKGFTLMELLIAVVILVILATIAMPGYQAQIQKARRSEATGSLLGLAVQMERYYADRSTYTGATINGLVDSADTENGHYTLSISSLAAESYTLQATPASSSQSGDECGSFTLTSANDKGVTGDGATVAECW